ncbi:Exocyst complex component [Vigna angularis]|uniref:Exocyst subunit Exo70 family protein n=1 Tax=Phaseolus angularis TaxID=3914 RepID=A0A8T0JSK2_PHAAN|nr:Exocyst complex component [Vigna angularis]
MYYLDPESVSARSSRTSANSNCSDCDDDFVTEDDDIRAAGDSITEVEQVSSSAMADMKLIVDCMVSSGYAKECVSIYIVIRKSIIDEGFYRLGVEKLSSLHANMMDWEVLDLKIKSWLEAVRIAVRILFSGERILYDNVFSYSDSVRESCCVEISKDDASLLYELPELFAKTKKSSLEKLFRVLDMHAVASKLLSEIESIFSSDYNSAVRSQMVSIVSDLAKSTLEKLINETIEQSRYICCFTCITDDFEKERENLIAKKETWEEYARVATRRGDNIRKDVTHWQKQAIELIEEDTKKKVTCFFGWCPNCKWQYSRGKELETNKEIVAVNTSNKNAMTMVEKGKNIKYLLCEVLLENLSITRCRQLKSIVKDESKRKDSREDIIDAHNDNKSIVSVFPNLTTLHVAHCPLLHSILPVVVPRNVPKLKSIYVVYCEGLKYIFCPFQDKHEEEESHQELKDLLFTTLKRLVLEYLPNFLDIFMCPSVKKSSSKDESKEQKESNPMKCEILHWIHKYRNKRKTTKISLDSTDQLQDSSNSMRVLTFPVGYFKEDRDISKRLIDILCGLYLGGEIGSRESVGYEVATQVEVTSISSKWSHAKIRDSPILKQIDEDNQRQNDVGSNELEEVENQSKETTEDEDKTHSPENEEEQMAISSSDLNMELPTTKDVNDGDFERTSNSVVSQNTNSVVSQNTNTTGSELTYHHVKKILLEMPDNLDDDSKTEVASGIVNIELEDVGVEDIQKASPGY